MEINNVKTEPWVGTKEICDHLGIKIETLRKWIKAEKIPCHRVGKLWKFKISEIDEWIINGKAKENQ